MPDPALHRRLPARELAAGRRTLAGTADAAGLAPRLAEALARKEPAGTVDYELSFAPGPGGAVAVTGRLEARLEATCQRCLRPFMLTLEVPVEVLLGADGSSRGGNEETGSGWEATDKAVSLGELIEEELLLALPFLPRHPRPDCAPAEAASGAGEPAGEDSRRPFAGLREALDAARRDGKD